MFRDVISVLPAQATTDGAGVAIQRVALMGNHSVDPLLMVDELRSPYRDDFAAGFPAHPHRGMQTLTYMKQGGIAHEDSLGNRGEIRDGGVQWMSAGSGVIHSEMPTIDTTGLHGFQCWFNLPAKDKMSPPRYRDLSRDALPIISVEGARLTAIAGDWKLLGDQLSGPLTELAPIAQMADLTLEPDHSIEIPVDNAANMAAFVYDGSLELDNRARVAKSLVLTGAGVRWRLTASSEGASCLLFSGQPLREPVVQYGPFVMNTREEIETALNEYRLGTFLKH